MEAPKIMLILSPIGLVLSNPSELLYSMMLWVSLFQLLIMYRSDFRVKLNGNLPNFVQL